MAVSRLIAGFLLGVVVTLAVVYWLDDRTAQTQQSPAGYSVSREEPVEAHQVNSSNGIDEATGEDGEDPDASSSAEATPGEEPSAFQAQSAPAPQQDAESLNPGQQPSRATNYDKYPPEIAEMIENRVDKDLQTRYENDEREESWATYMEGQLTAYFAQKAPLAQFNISLIDCRTSVCSVHALGYGPDALTRWNTATADLVSQQWFEFNSMSVNRRNPEPDILAVVMIITKKPPG